MLACQHTRGKRKVSDTLTKHDSHKSIFRLLTENSIVGAKLCPLEDKLAQLYRKLKAYTYVLCGILLLGQAHTATYNTAEALE